MNRAGRSLLPHWILRNYPDLCQILHGSALVCLNAVPWANLAAKLPWCVQQHTALVSWIKPGISDSVRDQASLAYLETLCSSEHPQWLGRGEEPKAWHHPILSGFSFSISPRQIPDRWKHCFSVRDVGRGGGKLLKQNKYIKKTQPKTNPKYKWCCLWPADLMIFTHLIDEDDERGFVACWGWKV